MVVQSSSEEEAPAKRGTGEVSTAAAKKRRQRANKKKAAAASGEESGTGHDEFDPTGAANTWQTVKTRKREGGAPRGGDEVADA